jgi:hypothetical protein
MQKLFGGLVVAENMKLIVIGHGGHGKDSVCEFLSRVFDLTFISSSWAACELIVYPSLKDQFGYESIEQCFDDRRTKRDVWYSMIGEYNKPDKTRLAREIYKLADVYCGLRCADEFNAIKAAGLFDYAIWVDASERVKAEPLTSCTVTPDLADVVLNNNGSSADLILEVYAAMQKLRALKNKNLHERRSVAGKKRMVA